LPLDKIKSPVVQLRKFNYILEQVNYIEHQG
jgi:hypothetical protein